MTTMVEMTNGGMNMIEDVVIIGGLIGVQFVYAGNAVLMSFLMSLGLSSLTIVIYTSFATFLLLLPFSFYFERTKWPRKFSFKFIIQLLLLSFGGVIFQFLFLRGISLTSPAMGTAMPNLAPGFIFVIAWTFRLEKVELSCTYSKVKILGTLVCVIGALTMSIMQSVSLPSPAREAAQVEQISSPPPDSMFDKNKIIGCLYLIAAVFMLSSNVVLQAFTLGDFPAPMTLCAITSLFGALMTIIDQLLEDHSFDIGWPLVSFGNLIAYSFLAGGLGGICLSFNGWALKKRGPVLVSMFSPVGTVCSVIFSAITLGYSMNLESLAGMLVMFTGLYFVLWAKGKEGYANGYGESEFDAEKPLLS